MGPRITGVLDWENARAGDPRADLARTVSILLLEARGHTVRPARNEGRAWRWRAAALADTPRSRACPRRWPRFTHGPARSRGATSPPKREAVELARLRAWTDARRRRAGLPDGR